MEATGKMSLKEGDLFRTTVRQAWKAQVQAALARVARSAVCDECCVCVLLFVVLIDSPNFRLQKDAQSLMPLTIKQILQAENKDSKFRVDGKEVTQVRRWFATLGFEMIALACVMNS
jgi:hypothetical protein